MRRTFLCLFILMPFLSIAQSNYKSGYRITNNGDSIPGFINYREKEQNPSSFTFKQTVTGPSQIFTISDSKGYGLNGLEKYERYMVDINQSKEALADVSVGLDSSSIRDSVFLKIIQAGKNLTLYAYSDPIKTRFYIKERESSEPYELIYCNVPG
jgi:hypothetical protein